MQAYVRKSLVKVIFVEPTSRRSRVGPGHPASQSDLVLQALKLYLIDPSSAFSGGEIVISTISALMVSPSPDFLRIGACKTCCALLVHIASCPKEDMASLLPVCVDSL